MGFEREALTLASHMTMVVTLALLAVRMLRAELDGAIGYAVRDHDLTIVMAVAATVFAVERLYYVFARALRPSGIDLYVAHPAPEFLSVMVTLAIYAIAVPVMRARVATWATVVRRIALELAAIAGFWGAVAWVVY